MARPALKRQVADYIYIVSHHGTTMRRACRLLKQYRSAQYYRSMKDPKLALAISIATKAVLELVSLYLVTVAYLP